MANNDETKEDKQFNSKVLAKCNDVETTVETITKDIKDIVLKELVTHWEIAKKQDKN